MLKLVIENNSNEYCTKTEIVWFKYLPDKLKLKVANLPKPMDLITKENDSTSFEDYKKVVDALDEFLCHNMLDFHAMLTDMVETIKSTMIWNDSATYKLYFPYINVLSQSINKEDMIYTLLVKDTIGNLKNYMANKSDPDNRLTILDGSLITSKAVNWVGNLKKQTITLFQELNLPLEKKESFINVYNLIESTMLGAGDEALKDPSKRVEYLKDFINNLEDILNTKKI